jgi:hypothetical protein
VNHLSLSSYNSADPSSLGSVVRGSCAGRSGHCCDYLLEFVGPSGLAPARPCVNPFHWLFLPGPRGDDLMNYGALGPFVRSFILLVDPRDICPPKPRTGCPLRACCARSAPVPRAYAQPCPRAPISTSGAQQSALHSASHPEQKLQLRRALHRPPSLPEHDHRGQPFPTTPSLALAPRLLSREAVKLSQA